MVQAEIIEQITTQLKKLKKNRSTILVGIDGGGGAGKSTFAKNLAAVLPNSTIVEVDDFYKSVANRVKITEEVPVHSNFEKSRFKKQVLEPLKRDEDARYQKYDWEKDRLKNQWEEISSGGYVIIEGLGVLGKELAQHLDYKIWLEAPSTVRRKRGIERDGEEWSNVWDEDYLPQDKRYIKEQTPQKVADIIINT